MSNRHRAFSTVLIYAVLFVMGVPWYWPPGDRTLWMGIPAWVVVSVLVSAVASLYTILVLCRRWPGEDQCDSERRP